MRRTLRSPVQAWRIWMPACLLCFLLAACSSGSGGGGPSESCLKGVYDCLGASGDCLLATSESGQVTVTWASGASVVGPMGLYSFDASGPGGESCFQRSEDGQDILITAADGQYRIHRSGDGSISVTCPGGNVQEHAAGEFPATAPGIDPDVLISCRVAGICSHDADCQAGEVCCGGKCETGERCPGTCEIDAHCGTGNRCCNGYCTSLPTCQVPCVSDYQCDDGVYCNGKETCVNRTCQVAAPIDCSDEVDCTEEHCDEAGRTCVVSPNDALCGADERCRPDLGCEQVITCSTAADCDDGDVCTTGSCVDGECEFSQVPTCCREDADCDDGSFCNGQEYCVAHECLAGQEPFCNDGVDCTFDSCDPARNECVFQPEHDACDTQQICDPVEDCVDTADCINDDYEPNDTQEDAYEAAVNSPYGPMMCSNDTDWFEFDLTSSEIPALVITYDPDFGELNAHVFGAGGQVGDTGTNPAPGVLIYSINEAVPGMTVWVQVTAVGAYIGQYLIILAYDD